MKKFIVAATIAVAFSMSAFTPAKANGGPYTWFASVDHAVLSDSKFNITLDRQESEDIVTLQIDNPGRKNLNISLKAPDGMTIDNFFTGRKFVKMNKNYNFSGADEGVYTLVISDGSNKITRTIKFQRITPKAVSALIIQ